MQAISDWLRQATSQLVGAQIGSAKLDAEIILAHTLRKSRTFLHAHGEEILTPRQIEIADARLQLRLNRTPIAYIIGHKEFYGRQFRVTPATLIPRPESETMIDMLKELVPDTQALLPTASRRLVDVGTGSGCLGISAKLECPELEVSLVDISRHALIVAETNAHALEAMVTTIKSDLLEDYPFIADFILANLPYVDPLWERSPETDYEPASALFAEHEGLALINKLLLQTPSHLAVGGYILLEADPRQHAAIKSAARRVNLSHQQTRGFIMSFRRD